MNRIIEFVKKISFSLNLLAVLLITIILIYNNENFNNKVDFVVDSFEYQTLGVNFHKKGQLNLMGFYDDLADYHFNIKTYADNILPTSKLFFEIPIHLKDNFYYFRDPGYPFFIGIIYKIFGVNPIVVKIIQIILLCLSILFLPSIYKNFFGERGKKLANISVVVIYFILFDYSLLFLTETLQIFLISIALLFLSKKTAVNYGISSFIFSLLILIKATIYPIILFVLIFFLLQLFKKQINIKTFLLCFFILFTLPLYWTLESNKTYFSSQSKYIQGYNSINNNNDFKVYSFIENSSLSKNEKKLIIDRKLNLNVSPEVPENSLYFGFMELLKFNNEKFFVSKRLNYPLLDCNNEFILNSTFIDWRLDDKSFYKNLINKGEERELILLFKFILSNPSIFLKLFLVKTLLLIYILRPIFIFITISFLLKKRYMFSASLITLLMFYIIKSFNLNFLELILLIPSFLIFTYLSVKNRHVLKPYFKNILFFGFIFSLIFFSIMYFPEERIIFTYLFVLFPLSLLNLTK